jgi:transmembrane sensor
LRLGRRSACQAVRDHFPGAHAQCSHGRGIFKKNFESCIFYNDNELESADSLHFRFSLPLRQSSIEQEGAVFSSTPESFGGRDNKERLALTAGNDIPSELDPLLRQALAWVIRLHSGSATSEDAAALGLWRQRSAEHEAAFRDAVRLWRSFGEATRELASESGLVDVERRRPRDARVGLSRRALIGGAMAASVAGGYVVVRPPMGLWPSFEELAADYRTAKGERRNIALSDNVALTLNTQTSIAVRSEQGAPRIELISGEAAIQAGREAPVPLVIDAAGGRVTALRASFNVRCLDRAVSVSCIEGDVEVEWKGQRVAISEEQQINYSTETGLGRASQADLEQANAWRKGLLIVRDWPVGRLVEEINRYRPGRIVVMDEQLGRRMISGTFHLDHLDDFIAQAHGLFGATARSLPGGIVLLS